MNNNLFLAVDLGASSGRLILGEKINGKIETEEVYRFENGITEIDGSLCWDIKGIFNHIIEGLKHCKEIGKIPSAMAIDTWGVDHVILDENDDIIGKSYAYRDPRTNDMPKKYFEKMSEKELYERTGCQASSINSLFQLYERKLNRPEEIASAKAFLMVPEYLNFLLTGVKKNEFTETTTSNMINVETGDWDEKVLSILGFEKGVFKKPCASGEKVGAFKDEVSKKVGFSADVYLAASHDTASAVLAIPSQSPDIVFISSGTWSILGIETDKPVISEAGFNAGFTNEGSFGGRNRYLKNINGLWFVQSVRRELNKKYSFGELADMARECSDFPSAIDVSDPRFIAPKNMIDEIKAFCRDKGLKVPESIGEVMQSIYSGLSNEYKKCFDLLSNITNKNFNAIHIVGGGSKDDYLDELTAKKCGVPVFAGPTECSATGNLLAQMLSKGVFSDVNEAKKAVGDTFSLTKYDIK